MRGLPLCTVLLSALVLSGCSRPNEVTELPLRRGPGRISVGQGYLALTKIGAPDTVTLRRAAQWRRLALDTPTASNLRLLALAHLSVASVDEAIRVFADLDAEQDPTVLSDSAAAYLARHAATGNAEDLFRALDKAEAAVRLLPQEPAVLFNVALTRSLAGLRNAALHAWDSYLAIEGDAGWRAEGEQHRAALRAAAVSRWHPGDAVTKANVLWARRWVEQQLLGALPFDTTRAPTIASQLATLTGDHMWQAIADERGSRPGLATYSAIADVRAAATANNLPARARAVQRACSAATQERSVLAPLCDYERAIVEYQQLNYVSAEARLRRVLTQATERGFMWLQGRAMATLSSLQIAIGQFSSSVETMEQASVLLESAGESAERAALQTQQADLLNLLGRQAEAWSLRASSLATAAVLQDVTADRSVYLSASIYCMNVGLHHASLAFGRMPDYERLPGLAEAAKLQRLLRATTAVGDFDEARALLKEVRAQLGASTDPRALTQRADVDVAEGLLRAAEKDDSAATDLIGLGISRMGLIRHRQRADALVWLSQAEVRLGRFDGARQHLRDVSAQVAGRVGRDGSATAALDERGWIWDAVSHLAIKSGGAEERETIELLEGAKSSWRDPIPDLSTAATSPDGGLLYYVATRDAIGAWIFRNGRSNFRLLDATPREITRQLLELREQLRHPVGAGPLPVLQRLRQAVIGPFEADLRGLSRLHVVPDSVLFEVPFPGLHDARTSRYLVEEVELSFSDRISAPADLDREPRPDLLNDIGLIGEPLNDAAGPLPGARFEVEEIARVHGGRVKAVFGQFATEEALRTMLIRATLFHFAGHAIASPDSPATSHLLLTRGQGTAGNDGRFSLAELSELPRLRAQPLVVLASCTTATQSAHRKFAAAHLAAEFISSGARAVIAAADEIPDASTPLYVRLHQQLRKGATAMTALRQAQRELIAELRAERLDSWIFVLGYTPFNSIGVTT